MLGPDDLRHVARVTISNYDRHADDFREETKDHDVGQNAVQLHGGMGMTDELAIGHYFKRLTMIDTMFGNVDHHLKRFGAL